MLATIDGADVSLRTVLRKAKDLSVGDIVYIEDRWLRIRMFRKNHETGGRGIYFDGYKKASEATVDTIFKLVRLNSTVVEE